MTTHRFAFAAAWSPSGGATVDHKATTNNKAGSVVSSAISGVKRWYRARKTASALQALDDRILQDVGLSRGDVVHTARTLAERYDCARPYI